MEKTIRIIILVGMVVAFLGTPTTASAQSTLPPFCQTGSLPSHDPKYPADQLILICTPPNWNGDLVMYAHGYVAVQEELALPIEELYFGGSFIPEVLLAQGYAFATTSYHKNGDAVEQARKDLNDLLNYFKKQVKPGSLQKVYLVGASEGGMVVSLMIEHFPDKYAGALAMCGPVGGGPYQIQYLSDFRAAFDYYFQGVFPFGVVNVPDNANESWQAYTGAIISTISNALMFNPTKLAQLYGITGAAVDLSNPETYVETAASILYYSIFGTYDLIATAGGMPYDNLSIVYADPLMDAGIERVQSDGRARAYIQRFYQTTGELQRPLVTLHNVLDPVVPFQHEAIYAGMAAQAGNSQLFIPLTSQESYGHCNFSPEEIFTAFGVLVQQAAFQP